MQLNQRILSMVGWILLAVYLVGIPVSIWVEKRFFPFEEGDYHIEFDGAHEITPELWKSEVITRAVIWPLVIAFALALIPICLLNTIFDLI